ncbi:Uncharacterised protein [Vibrio cholerae]|nr:Uncharacterised protein [Vibrio cholerae]
MTARMYSEEALSALVGMMRILSEAALDTAV